MLLAVDIGNTNISFAVMKGRSVFHSFSLAQGKKIETRKRLYAILTQTKKKYSAIRKAIICSVVPASTKDVEHAIMKCLDLKPLFIGKDVQVPLENKYRKPLQVGQDRLVGAYAAKILYGYPAVIIDLGTAITFDVVSESGAYEGGMIIPGIRLSIESLFNKTALLPLIEDIKSPKQLIGKSTDESILSGIFNGYGAMCSGLITQLSAEFSKKPKVIVTGGHIQLMKKYIAKKITAIEPFLVFKGLYQLSRSEH